MKTTRNRRNTCKRVLAMLTALTMSFSMLQSVAFASEGEDTTSSNPEITVIAVDGTDDETSGPDTTDTGDGTTEDGTTNEDGTAQVTPVDGESTEGTEDGTPADGENTEDTEDGTPADGENTEGTEDGTPADGENTENTENGIPADGENTEGTEDGTPAGGENTEDTEDGTPDDGETPQEPVEEEVPDFPVNGTAEEQQAWYEKYTKRPEQSDEVGTTTGDPTDVPQKPAEGSEPTETPEEPTNWSVFWNPETNSYELTYEIDENAEDFEQTIDLTKALELLNQYANEARLEGEPTKPEEPRVSLDEMTAEQKDAYEKVEKQYAEDLAYIKENASLWLSASDREELAAGDKADEWFVEKWNKKFESIPSNQVVVPQLPVADKDSAAYQEYLTGYEAYQKAYKAWKQQAEADVLQPGDIRKFEIFLTSKSGHTYKYKDGSFTLATPGFDENAGTVTGFDGQKIPDQYTKFEQTYNISGGLAPILNLFEGLDIPRGTVYNSESLEDLLATVGNSPKFGTEVLDKITQELGITYTKEGKTYNFSNVRDGLSDYLVAYYSSKDGKTYKDLTDVFAHSSSAASDMSSTDNQGSASKAGWTIEGEKILATYGKDYQYNNFYQSLLSFVYGNAEDVEKMLGAVTGTQSDSKHPEFDSSNWSSNLKELGLDYSVVLEQYMSHQTAWDKANDYFNQLLKDGLSVKDAVGKAFTMAVNIDGKLTSNDWQVTKWGWYNSIQLERTDYDFELVKTDENGNAITSDATAFQIWYVNENGEKVYFTQNENGEFTETTDPNAVVKTNEEGKLSSLYTLMKDKIYYLQEAEAPEGYVIDPTVYVLTDSADKIDEEKLQAEADAKKEALEKDLNALLENAPDYAASSEKFQELKKKIDAYLVEDGKTGSDTAAYADALQAQLNELKANDMSIKDLSATLNSTKDQVQADIDAFEAKREELTNLYNNASSRIDALNSSLQAEYDAFNAVKARYEASTDPAERAALRDQMTASQLEAQRLTSEMAAVKSAYDSNSLHTEYAALQAAAQGSLSSYNGYKSALDSITSTPEYQKLKERLETLQALKDAKAEMDGHASAKEIAKLEKQIELEANRTFKLIGELTDKKDASWMNDLSLSFNFENAKELEEKSFDVLLPGEFGDLSMSGIFNSPLPGGLDFTFDVPDPDPDPTPDPDPDPDPTPDPDPDPDPTPDPDPDPDPTPDPDPDPTPTPPDTVQSQLPPPNAPATPDVPDVTIPDAGVPLTDAPEAEEPVEELMEIPEEEVPLANPDVPKTGDISGIWYTMTFLAAAGLVFITILARKNQEEAQEN